MTTENKDQAAGYGPWAASTARVLGVLVAACINPLLWRLAPEQVLEMGSRFTASGPYQRAAHTLREVWWTAPHWLLLAWEEFKRSEHYEWLPNGLLLGLPLLSNGLVFRWATRPLWRKLNASTHSAAEIGWVVGVMVALFFHVISLSFWLLHLWLTSLESGWGN